MKGVGRQLNFPSQSLLCVFTQGRLVFRRPSEPRESQLSPSYAPLSLLSPRLPHINLSGQIRLLRINVTRLFPVPGFGGKGNFIFSLELKNL